MKISVHKGKPEDWKAEVLIVPWTEGEKNLAETAAALDERGGGLIREVLAAGDFDGREGQQCLLYAKGALPARRILLIGLGKREDIRPEILRGAYAAAARQCRSLKISAGVMYLEDPRWGCSLTEAAEACVEGVMLGLYEFTPFKTVGRNQIRRLERIKIVERRNEAVPELRAAVRRAEIVAGAVWDVRDLVSTPANEMTPGHLADVACRWAQRGRTTATVLEEGDMESLGMNAMLGVARGSDQPAKCIVMEYRGTGDRGPLIALVGKALTFDSGGICLKPAEKMDEMKHDMAGGAAVLGVVRAAAALGLPLSVVAVVPATENMPGGKALKPGDVLKSLSGLTIEVVNTDAEGRLILADALTYAARFRPDAVIDVATLTGACIIALGDRVTGMMGTGAKLKTRIRQAAEETGELVWELPLWKHYDEQIKSDVADWRNSGGRPAGTITGGAFLGKFTGEIPWVHLDIAGTAWAEKDRAYIPKGATGVGVRLLVSLLRNWPAGISRARRGAAVRTAGKAGMTAKKA